MSNSSEWPSTARRTKIVCTLGPVSRSPEMIEALIKAGLNVVRINMSHGTHDEHAETIANVRAVSKKLAVYIPIIMDLTGPKMRIGDFKSGSVRLNAGDQFTLTSRQVEGDWQIVSVNFAPLIDGVTKGDNILMGDGEIELTVESKSGTDVACRVVNGGRLHGKKGINAPGVKLKTEVPTEKDLIDVAFGVEKGVDWIAMSFVRTVDDLMQLRTVLQQCGSDIPIIVKIEKREALESIDAILEHADAMMIARGDLGLEVPIERVPFIQKDLVSRALNVVVPSIVATQMLESMMVNPRPTRAEVADVFNAVLDGADALMLSGETAAGDYPIEAVRTMAQTALESEARIDYRDGFRVSLRRHNRSVPEAVANAAVQMAIATDAKVIVCCTRSGRTASFVSNNRPPAKIAVVSPLENTLHRSMLIWNTFPIKIPLSHDTDTMIADAKAVVLKSGIAAVGDRVVIVAGVPVNVPGTTNMIKSDVL